MNDTHQEAEQGEKQTGFHEIAVVSDEVQEPRQALQNLQSFHLGLCRPYQPYENSLLPALIAPYRDLSEIRYDYPLCLLNKGEYPVMPLGNIFNQLATEVGEDGDRKKRLQHYLQKLEFSIKSLVDDGNHGLLSHLWLQASDNLYSQLDMDDGKNIQLKEDMESLRRGLEMDGNIIGCDKEAPLCVFQAILKANLQAKGIRFQTTLEQMSTCLENIIAADLAKSENAYSPKKLQETIGNADLDFSELSKILAPHVAKNRMTPKRRERIEKVLGIIRKLQDLYRLDNSAQAQEKAANTLTQIDKQMSKSLEYVKALQIAQLEAKDAYKNEHDVFFEGFGWNHVNDDIMAMCPPVVLILRGSELNKTDRATLLDALSQNLPLKIVLLVDELGGLKGWFDKLGEMAMSLQDVFVLQAACNNLPTIVDKLQQGFNYGGSALFCIFSKEFDSVSPYLASATAIESRAFPSFVYNPAAGATWAQRLSIEDSSDYSQDWPVSLFAFYGSDGQEVNQTLSFTYADFLALDSRFASHFMCIPSSAYHVNMVSLHEYLQLDPSTAKHKVPYLLMADEENNVHRVVVDWEVTWWTLQVRGNWRRLQELGGINNSHVLRKLDEEKRKLDRQKQEEIDTLEQSYQQQMEQHIGNVAETVIDKIAAGLLGFTSAASVTTNVVEPITPEPEVQSIPVKEAEQEEEETISIDEAYIETPRCTTCNECTNLNKQMFAYNENKQAIIKDPSAGTFRELVIAAEKCPARIIHPGKPLNPNEEGLEALIKRAKPFN